MKKFPFFLVAVIFLAITFCSRGQDYEYQFTAPITGGFEQGATDGSFMAQLPYYFYYETVSETAYYNLTANTLDQVGSITLSATGFSGSFEDDKIISGTLIPATVSVVYTLNGGNSTVSFNSGFLPVGKNPSMNWSIPFTESITVTTGGQNYTDVLSGSIPEPNTYASVSQFSPGSIVISQGDPHSNENIFSGLVDKVSASDGWYSNIYDGAGDGSLVNMYDAGPVTAYAVPEPGALMLFPIGAICLTFILGRPSSKAASERPTLMRQQVHRTGIF